VPVIADQRQAPRAPRRPPAPARGTGRTGGAEGNERLTATAGALLLVLLAAEGATLVSMHSLLTVHVFLGMLLVPPVALKLGATSWRFLRYDGGRGDYVRKGAPAPLMRFLVAPVVVASTLGLFGSGVALLAAGPGHPLLVGLHKASFAVWFLAMSAHVLAYVLRLPGLVGADLGRRERLPGATPRRWLVAGTLVAGATLAWATLPLVDPWRLWHGFG
jgi:hypothetical protein